MPAARRTAADAGKERSNDEAGAAAAARPAEMSNFRLDTDRVSELPSECSRELVTLRESFREA